MKRVLIFTYYWPPSGGAGVQRWLKFSKYLPEFGWEPVIITVDPKKATYPVQDNSLVKEAGKDIRVIRTDTSEWFSFYKKASGAESVPYSGFANESRSVSLKQKLARFIRGNIFLPDPRRGWNRFAVKAARQILKDENFNCIVTTSTPHSTHLIGKKISREFNLPWLADFRDPWTDIYYYRQFYPTIIAHKINLQMEREVLSNADIVTTVSPYCKTLLEEKLHDPGEKVQVITNGYDPENFTLPPTASSSDRFIITYIGTMTDIYPLDGFVDACKELFKVKPKSLLRLIGTISETQRKKLEKLPAENVEIISYVDHKTVISYLYQASVLLLLIPSHSSGYGILPGKMYEYMAVGKPILYIGPQESDGAVLIHENSCGEVLDEGDSAAMLDTMLGWYGKLPQIEPAEKFSRKILSSHIATLLNQITDN